VRERATLTLQALGMKKRNDDPSDRDQLGGTVTKRMCGGGGTHNHDPVIEDPRFISMQQQVGDLQSMVAQLLDTKVRHKYLAYC
jgi:hypothetical protein